MARLGRGIRQGAIFWQGAVEVGLADVGEVYLALTPSGVEERISEDAATAVLTLTPSGTEFMAKEYVDSGEVRLSLTPSATEERISEDSGTAYLTLTPSSLDLISGTALAPYYVEAVQGLTSNPYVWVTWDRNNRDATAYRVYRDSEVLAMITVTGDKWDKCAYKDTTVVAGTTYEYKVTAVESSAEGPLSSGASVTVRGDAQIGSVFNVDSQTGPTDREKINQAINAAKVAGGGIVQFGNTTYTLGDLTAVGDILMSACKNVVLRGHSSGGTTITTTDAGDPTNTAATERLLRAQGSSTTLSAVLTSKINEGDTVVHFDDVSWAIVGRKVIFDQGLANGIGSIATANGVTMDPGTPRDNARSYDINEIVSIDSGNNTVTFLHPFCSEFVINTTELNGRALPTIIRLGDNGGCGIENITFMGPSSQASDATNYLVHVKLDNIPDFFFAECTFKWANKSFVLHDDAGYVSYVGCTFDEQGAIADNPSSSSVYALNLSHAPNCSVVDCDFGVNYVSGGINRKSHVSMGEGAHRTYIRHNRFYDTTSYCVNTHGLGASDWLVENNYFAPSATAQRGSVFVGNSSWGFDHRGIVRNNKAVSGPRFIYGQENTYEVRVIANETSGLAANAFVATPCVVEAYGWDGPDTPSGLTGSLRWTIRENTDTGLSASFVRLEQIESSTYPTDGAGGGPSAGSWVRHVVHDSNSWNDTTDIVKPANVEGVPYDTSGGDPVWAYEFFTWVRIDEGTVRLSLTPSATEERVSEDSATVLLLFTPSATEERVSEDADTLYLDLQPSGVDEYAGATAYEDTGEVYLDLIASGTDLQEAIDANTTYLALTPSGVDIQEAADSNTVYLILTPATTDIAEFVDANTVPLLFTPSGDEFVGGQFNDAAEIYLDILPSGADIYEAIDAATVYLDLQASGTETREQYDSNTVPLSLTPSSTGFAEYVDSGLVSLVLSPSGTEFVGGQFTDADTVQFKLTASGVEVQHAEDSDTLRLGLFPSSTDAQEGTDTATAKLSFSPSGSDTLQAEESTTVNLLLTPSGVDQLIQVGSDEGTLYLAFSITGVEAKITLDYKLVGRLVRRWQVGSLAREGLPMRRWRARIR